jgi:hypothetical protein
MVEDNDDANGILVAIGVFILVALAVAIYWLWQLWPLLLAVAAIVLFFRHIARSISDSTKRQDLSLTCHCCGKLASPIDGTMDRYRCPAGRQFRGARHGL